MNKKLTPAQIRALNWLGMKETGLWFHSWANAQDSDPMNIPASESTLRILIEQGYIEKSYHPVFQDAQYRLIKPWEVDPAYRQARQAEQEAQQKRFANELRVAEQIAILDSRPKDLSFEVGQFVWIYINRTTFIDKHLGLVIASKGQNQFGYNTYYVQTAQGVFAYDAHRLTLIDELDAVVFHSGGLTDLREQYRTSTLFVDDNPVAWYGENAHGNLVTGDVSREMVSEWGAYLCLWLMVGIQFHQTAMAVE